MTRTEPKWHYSVSGQTLGPLTADEITQKLAAGDISEITQVCQVGTQQWQRLQDSSAWSKLTRPKPVKQETKSNAPPKRKMKLLGPVDEWAIGILTGKTERKAGFKGVIQYLTAFGLVAFCVVCLVLLLMGLIRSL